ncbi:NAD(P)H-dependent oxidoreductase [Methanobrevibacter acididurans]
MILTSPVYALNVSALMKNFIDHTSYFYHRPYFLIKLHWLL